MTKSEKIKLFFQSLKNNSPQAIQDAAAAVVDCSGIEDVIAGYIEGKGVDGAAPMIAELSGAQERARQKEIQDQAAADLAAKAGELAAEKAPEKRRELLGGIRRLVASLDDPGKKDRIGSWAGYIRECTEYDPEKDFRPALFNGLAFPPGTVSYIGARAKVGKTTAMINLARESIFSNRKVFFITLEMSRRQLLTKLVLCIAFAITGDTPQRGELRGRGSFERKEQTGNTPQKDFSLLLRGKPLDRYGGEEAFIATVNQAQETVKNSYGKTLLIYDGRGAGFQEITRAIEQYSSPGSLVLIDYIQRMPPADESGKDDYTRVKKISDGVLMTAMKTNTVIISGAQFNRTVTRNDAGDEIIETTSFRESGDLEQDGFNLLGMARLAGKGKRYIKMFAGREEMIEDDAYSLDFEGAYSYMAIKEKIKAPEEGPRFQPRKKKQETAPEEKNNFSEAVQEIKRQGELL